MLTNAYWITWIAQLTGNPKQKKYKMHDGTERIPVKVVNNSYSGNLHNTLTFRSCDTVLTTIGQSGVVFGDGTTASIEDYKLSGNIISTISATVADASEDNDSECIKQTRYTINNTGTTAVTISEIGLYSSVPYGAASVSTALIEHTVLESPITIEPGGVGQVTYTIRLNYPTV